MAGAMAMSTRRSLALAVALLGVVGTTACVVAMTAAIWGPLRLSRANDRAVAAVDGSLARAGDLVARARERIRAVGGEDLADAIRDWGSRRVDQELVERLDARADRARERLEQSQAWIEASAASIRSIAVAFGAIDAMGGDEDGRVLSAASNLLDDLTTRVQAATEAIATIRQRAASLLEEEARQERIEDLQRLAGVVRAAVGQIDGRLGETAERLGERRARLERLRLRTRRWIVTGAIAALLLLAWMAAGQAALCAYGWKRRRAVGAGAVDGYNPPEHGA
jgi:hypothetical protein